MYGIVLNVFIFLVGLFFLIYGSDFLIQACIKLSYLLKLTPLFIGIIFVAFGTSAPELAVGIIAAVKNQKAIALGNIVGSNISNIGLILGSCALIRSLKVDKSLFKKELPIMLLSVGLLYLLSRDLILSRVDAFILLILLSASVLGGSGGGDSFTGGLEELS